MSTTVNASNNSSETAKSLGLKILSVVGLTLFAGSYVNSWQSSLAEYAQQQEQEAEETIVATSTTDTPTIIANTPTSKPTIAPSTSVVASAVDTTESVSAVNTVPVVETSSIETQVAMAAVPETQAAPKVITDSNTLEKLNSMLYNQIDQAWKQYPTFSENLAYRVTINSAGMVAKYEHINKAASEYIGETPLAKLANSSIIDENKPTAEYLVLLTPNGVVQVNQWLTK
ncbi:MULTISPECIES: hypothetical protein [Okeania]|uniref:Uncharacterized protein n=1 Tax=Okeania hirsuta TaxID=1458930 RepID=A0A3N6PQL8_9CYAN|nr:MULTISPECIES: hypothetical protein [Okeania]NES88533.1 hypothetical protein [Okeania sp. SIO2B9]NET80325.1 hypothetical protein [Okeania sp. SIO1F9]RQH48726.1 hypothetical protein D5R40_07745 [Okeania hirsuta]